MQTPTLSRGSHGQAEDCVTEGSLSLAWHFRNNHLNLLVTKYSGKSKEIKQPSSPSISFPSLEGEANFCFMDQRGLIKINVSRSLTWGTFSLFEWYTIAGLHSLDRKHRDNVSCIKTSLKGSHRLIQRLALTTPVSFFFSQSQPQQTSQSDPSVLGNTQSAQSLCLEDALGLSKRGNFSKTLWLQKMGDPWQTWTWIKKKPICWHLQWQIWMSDTPDKKRSWRECTLL